jgi:DNA-binding HxlR family transcriptional regulator
MASDPTTPAAAPASSPPARPEVPRPGGIYDPVGRALDAIGDRWSLVLLRHLLLGPKGFQELRMRTGITPRVLSSRLKGLIEQGFVAGLEGTRGGYAITDLGRSLEPIVASIARWFTRYGTEALHIDSDRFTETSPQSIIESLPFLLREESAREADVTFEIRLTGHGGGVWTVRIRQGTCTVEPNFAERADVRYTADAKTWCAVALGVADAREVVRSGAMTKEGADDAMDHYFHQIHRKAKAAGGSNHSPGASGESQ